MTKRELNFQMKTFAESVTETLENVASKIAQVEDLLAGTSEDVGGVVDTDIDSVDDVPVDMDETTEDIETEDDIDTVDVSDDVDDDVEEDVDVVDVDDDVEVDEEDDAENFSIFPRNQRFNPKSVNFSATPANKTPVLSKNRYQRVKSFLDGNV